MVSGVFRGYKMGTLTRNELGKFCFDNALCTFVMVYEKELIIIDIN